MEESHNIKLHQHHSKIAIYAVVAFLVLITFAIITISKSIESERAYTTESQASEGFYQPGYPTITPTPTPPNIPIYTPWPTFRVPTTSAPQISCGQFYDRCDPELKTKCCPGLTCTQQGFDYYCQ